MVKRMLTITVFACALGLAGCVSPDGQGGTGGRVSGAYVSGSGGYLTH
ncbi:hypothetical protein [Lichenicola sp.]